MFLGFPLHLPGQPSDKRGEHLFKINVPMLFLQGDRDEFARFDLLEALIGKLGARATLKLFANANHSFHVPARTGRKDPEVLEELLSTMKDWIEQVLAERGKL
jgi:predicted alpha/beta-hydrolase family hydrolase